MRLFIALTFKEDFLKEIEILKIVNKDEILALYRKPTLFYKFNIKIN